MSSPSRAGGVGLVVALVLPGCLLVEREPQQAAVVRPPTAFDVWVHDGRRARRAIVDPVHDPARDPPAAGDPAAEVLRLLWTDPAPRPGRDLVREVRWVFAGLAPPATLRLTDGQVLEHPDPATVADLALALATSPPDVEAVLAGLSRLHRCESRGALLARAAAAPALHPTSFATLLAAVTTQRERVALGPGPEALPVGGDARDALLPALTALAARDEVGPAEARALLEAAQDLPRSGDRAAVLLALARAPLAPVDPDDALAAAARLEASERRDALLAIAGRLPLTAAHAARALDVTATLRRPEWRADVLVALAGRADEDALRRAAEALGGAQRERVLGALGRE